MFIGKNFIIFFQFMFIDYIILNSLVKCKRKDNKEIDCDLKREHTFI